jgi:beta-glucosidase
LAETFPLKLSDTPCYEFFGKDKFNAEYREGIFTGYRYYDTAKKEVLFPFGHGLSYTSFEYSGYRADEEKVTLSVKNTGGVFGREVIQIYVMCKKPSVYMADKKLAAFAKVALAAGESKEIGMTLDPRAFAFYNTTTKEWETESGEYELLAGSSSRDIRIRRSISVQGSQNISHEVIAKYSPDDFEKIYRHNPKMKFVKPFSTNTPLFLFRGGFWGRIIYKILVGKLADATGMPAGEVMKTAGNLPIRFLALAGGGLDKDIIDGIVLLANGKIFRAIPQIRKIKEIKMNMRTGGEGKNENP